MRFRGGCGARAARTCVLVCAAFVAATARPASSRDVADDRVDLAWAPAAGPVGAYGVFVSRNGGPFRSEQYVATPRATVTGGSGETIQVRVRAYGIGGLGSVASAVSEASETIRFQPPAMAPAAAAVAPPASLAPEPPASAGAAYGPAFSIVAGGDFDGDGDLDLIATLDSWQHPLALFLEHGVLDALACLPPQGAARAAFAADFDGDGRDELALQTRDQVTLLRIDRAGGVVAGASEPVTDGARVLAADLDGDGKASLVVYDPASGGLSERRPGQQGATDFGAILPLNDLQAGDFDGDGRDDLWVQAHAGGESELWLTRDPGRFEVVPLHLDGRVVTSAALDWNGDGRDDLAGYDTVRGELRAWLLDGGRVLDRPRIGTGPVTALQALDLDDDGRKDLLVSAPGRAPSAVLSTR